MELDGGDVKQLLSILQQLVEKVTVANSGSQPETDNTETTKTTKRKKKTNKKETVDDETVQDEDSYEG